jgi:UPF0042 nucleotide-binding protein
MATHRETRLVIVTGPSGAGRATALNALEDFGFEAIDNLPLTLIPRLLDGPTHQRDLALGVDPRNRDFSAQALMDLLADLEDNSAFLASALFLDASDDVLIRRFSETRRRHPNMSADTPQEGIASERELLAPIREQTEFLIDTSNMSPHDLRAELAQWFAPGGHAQLALSVQSFSYKRGLPRGVDMVFDCRFLRNPHWEETLRAMDGRAEEVSTFVQSDPRFPAFSKQVFEMVTSLLPAFSDEGKTYLTVAFGCTGGKHRSVALTEWLAKSLANKGLQVSKRHRELERRGSVTPSEN